LRQSDKQEFAQRAGRSLVPADFRDVLEKETHLREAALTHLGISVRDVQVSPRT